MTRDQFQFQLSRLSNRFGKNVYSTELAKLILETVEEMDADWFQKLCSHFIGSLRQAPLVPDFRDAVLQEKERQWQKRKQEKQEETWNENYDCDYCKDRGVYVCTLRGDRRLGLWAFRCHCRAGVADERKHIPEFKSEHARQGYIFQEMKQ